MDIAKGFQIEAPGVFALRVDSEQDLRALLDSRGSRHVTSGYYAQSCVSLGGLSHELGFHLLPRPGGVLSELEFFRRSYEDQKASFDEFQKHLEGSFGKPAGKEMGAEGFPSYTWI